MLGLKRGVVQVVAYHPEWRELFEQERLLLLRHDCKLKQN